MIAILMILDQLLIFVGLIILLELFCRCRLLIAAVSVLLVFYSLPHFLLFFAV